MQRECFVFANPLSGGYSPKRISEALSMLSSQGYFPRVEEITTPAEAALRARGLCEETSRPFIVVAGGDGTINGVVNGLVPGVATLAVLPLGTSNVLSRELGITSLAHALEKIAAGISRHAAVGHIQGSGESRYFLLMAGIGVDGAVVKGVRAAEKRLLGKGAYLLSALRLLSKWEEGTVRVVAETSEIECHSVIVCNASRYGGNRVIAPGASLFEPELQVICLRNGTRGACLKCAFSLTVGRGLEGADVISFGARELEIQGVKPLQADGDYYFDSPVRIRSVPSFLRLIV